MGELDFIFEDVRNKVKLESRNNIFNKRRILTRNDLINPSEPEEFTKLHVIEPIFQKFNVEVIDREVPFKGTHEKERIVDYAIRVKDKLYLVEAKPINADLVAESDNSALGQLKEVFKLVEAFKKYDGGIATDGINWILIDKDKKMICDIRADKEPYELESLLVGRKLSHKGNEVKVTKQFYDWYCALLSGGQYKGMDKKKVTICPEDSLVNSITGILDEKSRMPIAQTIMDRLIFIKFLESKGIVKGILSYLASLQEDRINEQMKSLFFSVMSVEPENRRGVNQEFKDVPFLNGGLFTRTEYEEKESDYRINYDILQGIFSFLEQFKFVGDEGEGDYLDPEILGYIFEMSMSEDKKTGTGAVYTPKQVTRYMSRVTIEQKIIEKTNEILRQMGYKEEELVTNIDEVYCLREKTLDRVFTEVLLKIKICDNACGSGAFLLSCAEVLLDIYNKVDLARNSRNSVISHKKLILKHNIFGVDINKDAVEIAKLRLWLWVADSYNSGRIEPLPNIDYNVRAGNTLIGYTKISQFYNSKPRSIEDWGDETKLISTVLSEREKTISEYNAAHGAESKLLKKRVEKITASTIGFLNGMYYREKVVSNEKNEGITKEDLMGLTPFHWELEFSRVIEDGGFDIIIGNPPYLHIQGIVDDLGKVANLYNTNYESATGNYDLYVLFVERSLQLINSTGVINYIMPPKWTNSDFGKGLRDKLSKDRGVDKVISLGAYQVFTVSTYSSLIWFSNKTKDDLLFVRIGDDIENNTELESKLNSLEYEDYSLIPYSRLSSKEWELMPTLAYEIIEKMRASGITVKDVFDKIFQGIATSQDSVYVLSNCKEKDGYVTGFSKQLNRIVTIESELVRPMLRGENVKRYTSSNVENYVLIPYNLIKLAENGKLNTYSLVELQEKFPKGYEYIMENEVIIRARERGKIKDEKDWYRYIYPKNLQNFCLERIMTPEISLGCNMTVDRSGTIYHNTKVYSFVKKNDIKEDLYYYLGILNSPVLWYYLYNTGYILRGGYLTFKTDYLNPFPLPEPKNEELIDSIITLVNDILLNRQRGINTANLENELNSIIYSLYGLDSKEIEEINSKYPKTTASVPE